MQFLTAPLQAVGQDLYTSSSAAQHDVGQRAYGMLGRIYRYALAGASDLVIGNLLQESAEDTSYENMAIGTAAVAGDLFFQVTNGTATITSDQFVGGQISVYTAGTILLGDTYDIVKITGTLTTGGALKVYTDRPVRKAATTSTKVVMKRNPFSGVVQFPTTQTGMPIGVAQNVITTTQFGWVLTHGECSILSDGSTFAVGSQLSPSLSVAGAVGVNVAGTTHGVVGWAREAAASTHNIACFLQID